MTMPRPGEVSQRSRCKPWTATLLALLPLASLAVLAPGVLGGACGGREPQAHYSSKTAYEFVHNEKVDPIDQPHGCETVYIWHLLRHGTRYPSSKEIEKLLAGVPELQKRLRANKDEGRVGEACNKTVDRVLDWKLEATPDQGDTLHKRGEQDLHGIGKRLKERHPAFFENFPNAASFTFRSTNTSRTRESAQSYALGVFNHRVELPPSLDEDPLLKLYAICEPWEESVHRNKTAQVEVDRFRRGKPVSAALERVSRRLGFKENETLTYEDVALMWNACRYEQAWNLSKEAAWCEAFDDEDLLVFEYGADLKYYYVDGYGNEVNLELGCPLVQDLVDKLSAAERGEATSRGSMYFTHSTAIHATLARLGLLKDSNRLVAASYDQAKHGRLWDISQNAPFAANLAAVLYECKGSEPRHRYRLFVNEWPIPIENCDDSDHVCPWSIFRDRFNHLLSEKCNSTYCRPASSAAFRSTAGRDSLSLLAAMTAVATLIVRCSDPSNHTPR